MTLAELLDWARGQAGGDSQPPADMVAAFKPSDAPFNAFIYHIPMPADAPRMNYPDMAKTRMDYDYDKIVAYAAERVRRYGGRPILVDASIYPFNAYQPMYERVRAMAAYVHSAAFNAPTVFLDGDAFLNADPIPAFNAITDIGVTYRNHSGFMPLNEGVIYAKPTDRTRAFFRSYLATYEHLIGCPEIKEHYGDIRPWRGGQLSLNAVASLGDVHSEMDHRDGVSYLPCDIFNYSIEVDRDVTAAELDQKAVLHLKGPRKRLVDTIMEYQGGR